MYKPSYDVSIEEIESALCRFKYGRGVYVDVLHDLGEHIKDRLSASHVMFNPIRLFNGPSEENTDLLGRVATDHLSIQVIWAGERLPETVERKFFIK